MAILQDYIDVAPDVMSAGDFTLTQIENKMSSIPDPPDPPSPPSITQVKVVAIFNTIFSTYSVSKSIEAAGGINEIAKTVLLWPSQVRELIKQLVAMKAVYDGDQ